MPRGFKDFLMRGNVIDLAVAVVIGGAFTAIVTAIVKNLVTPVLAAIGGGGTTPGLSFILRSGNEATRVDFGALVSAIIAFLITAAVVYFIFVVPKERIEALHKRLLASGEEPEVEPSEEARLLREIRDSLQAMTPAGSTMPLQVDPGVESDPTTRER